MTAEAFEKIELLRNRIYKGIRFSYNFADNILVVKMPGAVHELLHTANFTRVGLKALGAGTWNDVRIGWRNTLSQPHVQEIEGSRRGTDARRKNSG